MKKLTKQLDWNLLRTFVVIVEEKSVSRAAEFLSRGQPAISAALNRLESIVGYRLAQRSASGFILTAAGKLLYREAREIVGEIDRLSTMMEDLESNLSGTVRLTMASHMTSPLIDDAIAKFHAEFPKSKFDISVLSAPKLMDEMASGLIYCAIAPVHTKREDFEYSHIFREYCGYYCGPGHALYGKTNLTLKDLCGEQAVSYKSDIFSDSLQSISEMRASVKFAEPIIGVASDMREVRRMIIAGLGIGPIPIHIAQRDVEDGLLWRLPPYEPTMPINVYLITNPRAHSSQTQLKFVKLLKELVASTSIELRTYPESLKTGITEMPRRQNKTTR